MIVTVPAVMALTRPVSDPTVAIRVLLLLHVPPAMLSVNVTEAPAQTDEGSLIVAGAVLTVIVLVI